MKAILMRHGEAEYQTQQDSKRTLTKLGNNKLLRQPNIL